MEEINYYIKKYLLIVIILWVIKKLVRIYFPGLFFSTIVAEGYTKNTANLLNTYYFYVYSFILSLFVLFDLNNLKLNKIYIPILTFLSTYAGLFFFSLMLLNKLTEENYG